ncbi:MAG: hypothetical protein ACE5GS_05990 [Kiloniellaceae bacterium]
MRNLKVRPLSRDRIGQAFPLLQASLPEVSLEHWRKFASPLVSSRAGPTSGILTVVSEQDYIAGLSIYRIEPDLQHGAALIAEHFMALDLFDRTAVVHALAEALEALGREHGCAAIHTSVPERYAKVRAVDGGLVSALCSRGHRVESLRLCKLLGHPARRETPGEDRRGHDPPARPWRTAASPVEIG